MKKYIPIISSTLGGILLMYGATHERAFYILGLSFVFAALKFQIFER